MPVLTLTLVRTAHTLFRGSLLKSELHGCEYRKIHRHSMNLHVQATPA
jgi:hypothetical protein